MVIFRTVLTGLSLAALFACSTDLPEPEMIEAEQPQLQISTLDEGRVYTGVSNDSQRRLIADILFEGLQALDADRLLTPVDDSAHARFQRVLALDPGNEIALQGLEDIVTRYLELSTEASRRGLFDEAEEMLERARFVDSEHPAIVKAWLTLQAERNSGDLFFDLELDEVRRQSAQARQQLEDIAQQAKQHQAFFLITAPSDDQARWMYSVMRAAVNGYRLRGNIELASRTSIRLRMPSVDAGEPVDGDE